VLRLKISGTKNRKKEDEERGRKRLKCGRRFVNFAQQQQPGYASLHPNFTPLRSVKLLACCHPLVAISALGGKGKKSHAEKEIRPARKIRNKIWIKNIKCFCNTDWRNVYG
jgi:hypothetical protein